FKLVLRGSRDGFTGIKFHEICDNQSQTVSIIKVKDSNEILGGYNPIKWRSIKKRISYDITKDSFIFSFKDKDNIDNYILSRLKNEKRAIENWYTYGPSFGKGDLITLRSNDTSSCVKYDYERQIRDTEDNFSVEEYEVF